MSDLEHKIKKLLDVADVDMGEHETVLVCIVRPGVDGVDGTCGMRGSVEGAAVAVSTALNAFKQYEGFRITLNAAQSADVSVKHREERQLHEQLTQPVDEQAAQRATSSLFKLLMKH